MYSHETAIKQLIEHDKETYLGCIIERIGNEYQTVSFNIGRYSTKEKVKELIDDYYKF